MHSYEHLVADCLQLVRLARGGSDALATRERAGECTLGLPSDLADKLTELPYFVSGQVRNACTAVQLTAYPMPKNVNSSIHKEGAPIRLLTHVLLGLGLSSQWAVPLLCW